MSAVRHDVQAIERDLVDALETIRETMGVAADTIEDDAVVAVECFCKIALEVFRSVPPKRIRAVARHFEIHARLNGAEVLTIAKHHELLRNAPLPSSIEHADRESVED